jgi:hypothetical protein
MIPPMVMRVQVREPGKRGFRIWLPLFLLWLVLALLAVPLLILALLADAVLVLAGRRLRLTRTILAVWGLVCQMRGLRVDVTSQKGDGGVHVACQ